MREKPQSEERRGEDSLRLLTALLLVLVRVVPAIVLSVTFPGQRLAEGVITLELIMGALSPNWKKTKQKPSQREREERERGETERDRERERENLPCFCDCLL